MIDSVVLPECGGREPTILGSVTAGGSRGTKMTEQVFCSLLQAILSFEFKPRDELSEGRLADQMGVSRTPVRESLAKLAALKFVDIYPQRGTVIAPLRADDLIRSQFLRESLEIGLVRRAIRAPGRDKLVAKLHKELKVQEAFATIGDERRFYQSDEALHQLIAESAGLTNIWSDIVDAKLHMDRFRHLMLASVEQLPLILQQHRDIVEAIESGDEGAAELVMKRHLRRIFAFVDRAYSIHPNYFDAGWQTSAFVSLFDD